MMSDLRTCVARRVSVVPFAVAVLLAAAPTTAQTVPGVPGLPGSPPVPKAKTGDELARMSILPERVEIPAGGSAWVLVRLAIEPKWHVYWRNPGDSGVPVELTWSLPKGVSAGEIRWPRPEVFRTPYEVTYGYGDEVGLLVELRASKGIDPGDREASLRGDWMICKEMCLVGGATRAFEIEVRSPGVAKDPRPEVVAAIDRWRAEVPRTAPPGMGVAAEIEFEGALVPDLVEARGVLRVSGPAGRFQQVRFLPDATPGTRYPDGGPVEGRVAAGRFEIEVPISVRPGDALGEPMRAAGIVCLGHARTDPAFEIEVPIVPPNPGESTAP